MAGVAGMAGMGGQAGGVLGGVMGSLGNGPPVVTRAAPPKPTGPQKVSSGTIAGLLLAHRDPIYPPIAKAAHVQGAVILHATISKTGTIEDLKAISGPPMLQGAAMDAVRTWHYKPYLLNGDPTEVETTITVNFTFGQ
jgi:protein TonB